MLNQSLDIKNAYELIGELEVSKFWKNKFKLIYLSYFNNFLYGKVSSSLFWRFCPQLANLSFSNKMKFDSRSNFFALLFGPLYYLFKGMYVKGILMLLICIVALYYDMGLVCILPFIFVFCSYNADLDYFSKILLDDVRVHNNPNALIPLFDKKFATKMLKRPLGGIYFRKASMLFLIVLGVLMTFSYVDSKMVMRYFNGIEKHCSDYKSCLSLSGTLHSRVISSGNATASDYYNLGCALFWAEQKSGALESFSRAKAIDPDDIRSYAASAYVYADINNYKNAILAYEQILNMNPSFKFVYYYMGRVYYKAGSYVSALNAFDKAVKAYPDEPAYLEARAYAKIYLNDFKGARQDIETTILLLQKRSKTKNASKIVNLQNYLNSI